MKKSMKKLVLAKETVRRLVGADLNGVVGAGITAFYTCDCHSFEWACKPRLTELC